MGYRDVGPFDENSRGQLQYADRETQQLRNPVLTVVVTDFAVLQARKIGKLADLETVPRREENGVPLLLQLADDWQEERDVRRVLEINPDGALFRGGFHRSI